MFRFNLSLLCGLLIVAVSFRLSEQTGWGITCPNGWQCFEGACYVFVESLETWSSAQAKCAAHGARLAEIENERENNFLKNIARSKSAKVTWLGGTDMFKEGHWTWASNRRSIDSFTNWNSGEPNNYLGDENCLGFYNKFDYKWNDSKCDIPSNYICEQWYADGLTCSSLTSG